MSKIVQGPELLDALRSAIRESGTARFAIAFWGAGAIEALGLTEQHDIEIVCNLSMGGTNPEEIERLMALGARVYVLDTLHAKMGFGGKVGFVGSSNASANGLAMQGSQISHWNELNVIFDSEPDLERLQREFEDLRSLAGSPLKTQDPRLRIAKQRWERRRLLLTEERVHSGLAQTLLAAMREDPERFRDQRAFLIIYPMLDPLQAKEFEATQNEVKAEYGSEFDCYWDWDQLPQDGYFLDFSIGSRGGATPEGIYRRHHRMPIIKGGEYQLCESAESICGFSSPVGEELREWKSLISKYWRSLPEEQTSEGRFIDFYTIATNWLKPEKSA